jgi:hypothetical protein
MITLKLQPVGGWRVACVFSGPSLVTRSFAARLRGGRGDAGYALTDALVAMLILSLALVLSLRALGQAREVVEVAWEVRRADSLIGHLIEAAPHRYEASAGTSDGFRWTVETAITGAERPIEVCRRAVGLTNLRSGRAYAAATLETCPVEPLAGEPAA